jgi:hypothetical protein
MPLEISEGIPTQFSHSPKARTSPLAAPPPNGPDIHTVESRHVVVGESVLTLCFFAGLICRELSAHSSMVRPAAFGVSMR